MIADQRAPFSPSPRIIEHGAGPTLTRAARVLLALSGCFRRAGDCPRLCTHPNRRLWRWLCMPAGAPLQ